MEIQNIQRGPAPVSKQAQIDQSIHWLTLANQPMDLGGFQCLIAGIEQLQHTQLTAWKELFTSTFLSSLKRVMKAVGTSTNPRLCTKVCSMSNFSIFVGVYERFHKLVTHSSRI
jgi:hypothetical protein